MISRNQAPAGHPCKPSDDGHGENIYTRLESPGGAVNKDSKMAIDVW